MKIAENSTFKQFKIQNYLKHPDMSKEDGQILFALRSRSIDLKNNYKQLYNYNTICRLCTQEESIESESHLLTCDVLKGEVREDEQNITTSDLFGPTHKQIKAVKLFKRVLRRRKIYMDVMKL